MTESIAWANRATVQLVESHEEVRGVVIERVTPAEVVVVVWCRPLTKKIEERIFPALVPLVRLRDWSREVVVFFKEARS
jgi:hypothetical protein